MPRVLILALLVTLVLYVSSQKIVFTAFQKVFPDASETKVKALTTNVNKQTTKKNAKAAVRKWVPANWRQSNSTLLIDPANDSKLVAQKKALSFIDHRYSLKKYVNFLYNQAVNNTYLTKPEANEMRRMFWAADKKATNNYTVSAGTFMYEASLAFKKSPTVQQEFDMYAYAFYMRYPKDITNLFWKL